MVTSALGLEAAQRNTQGRPLAHAACQAHGCRDTGIPHRTRCEAVIARLLGLFLVVLAAWPASAEVRVEGVAQAAAKRTHAPGLVRFITRAGDRDEGEREPPRGPAFAAEPADADQPETVTSPAAWADFLPARDAPDAAPSRPSFAPWSHRACAAPPTGPPAG
jgi:hypothetical protein